MAALKDRVKSQLDYLVKQAVELSNDLSNAEPLSFTALYQLCYTRALGAVRELVPDRLQEFEELYQVQRRKKIAIDTYGIQDFVLGIRISLGTEPVNVKSIVISRFMQQTLILQSAQSRVDDVLSNVRALVQAEIFDNEIEAARELLKANHFRAAGTIAGVVLERHLAKVCASQGIKTKKRTPGISEWNDKLRDAGVFDLPIWRKIQQLADLRNLCVHPRQRDPTKEEVDELISGAEKIMKTIG